MGSKNVKKIKHFGRRHPIRLTVCLVSDKSEYWLGWQWPGVVNNTVIERPQLTGMGVIQCYALLEWGIIRFKCINK